MTEKIAANLVRYRVATCILGVLIILACLSGIKKFEIRNDYRSFFKDGNTYLDTSDWISDRRGESQEIIVLIYQPEDRDVFSMLSMLQYSHIAETVKKFAHVTETKSWMDMKKIVQVPTQGNPKAYVYKSGYFDFGLNLFAEEGRQILKRDALQTPTIAGRYVSFDGSTAAILVFVEIESKSKERISAVEIFIAQVRALEKELQQAAPGDRIQVAGSTLFDYAAFSTLRDDVRFLFPFVVLLIISVLYALYRSALFVVFCFLLILFPVLATAGLLAGLGFFFSTLSISGMLLVGTLAVADVIHISNSFFLNVHQGMQKDLAIQKALQKNLWAVTATTVTTALGQVAMLYSASPPVQIMGTVVMTGSFLALILALLIMPLLLMSIRVGSRQTAQRLSLGLSRISAYSYSHPGVVLGIFIPLLLLVGAGMMQSHITDTMSGWFSEKTDFRQGMDALDTGYLGGDTITMAMAMPIKDQLSARAYPKIDDRLQSYFQVADSLTQQSGPGKWVSLVDSLNAAKGLFEGKENTGFRLPATGETLALNKFNAETVANVGLMTPLSLGKKDYSLWYFDSAVTSSFDLLDVISRVEQTANDQAGNRQVRVGGIGPAFAELGVQNYWYNFEGSILAFGLITIVLIFIFRSLTLGLVSIIPNLAPIVFTYGLWGWFVGEVNLAAITVYSVALGIVVDDTIHVVVMYRRYRDQGLPGLQAVEEAIRGSGTGLLTTTVLIAGGFFILSFSGFLLTAHKVLLAGTAVTAAFVFDIAMVPALLALLGKVSKGKQRQELNISRR